MLSQQFLGGIRVLRTLGLTLLFATWILFEVYAIMNANRDVRADKECSHNAFSRQLIGVYYNGTVSNGAASCTLVNFDLNLLQPHQLLPVFTNDFNMCQVQQSSCTQHQIWILASVVSPMFWIMFLAGCISCYRNCCAQYCELRHPQVISDERSPLMSV
jgi:hypothetical protein